MLAANNEKQHKIPETRHNGWGLQKDPPLAVDQTKNGSRNQWIYRAGTAGRLLNTKRSRLLVGYVCMLTHLIQLTLMRTLQYVYLGETLDISRRNIPFRCEIGREFYMISHELSFPINSNIVRQTCKPKTTQRIWYTLFSVCCVIVQPKQTHFPSRIVVKQKTRKQKVGQLVEKNMKTKARWWWLLREFSYQISLRTERLSYFLSQQVCRKQCKQISITLHITHAPELQ